MHRRAAGIIHPVHVEISRACLGNDCLQIGGSGRGGQPLDQPHIGHAYHPDFAVRPGLRAGPVQRIPAVVDFLSPRMPFAFRIVASAYVLQDVGVPALGIIHCAADVPFGSLSAVGAALHDHRPSPGFVREEDVGRQPDAVPHRHFHIDQRAHLVVRFGK